ncbi:MAG: DNA methylase N-4/N-6 domain-containing protein [Ignavibacteria bacterium]|nr:MAG: DNA methylase N-4/N-6 domain-containing protein [Ignavibacteria bacterium]KAF0159119.1 MAG: DNA methylase N-4/N-6 domain-containing protein [Ignavibacteria bacterium]
MNKPAVLHLFPQVDITKIKSTKDLECSSKPHKRKPNQINDLDLENWKSLDHIWTDSLWLIPQRDNSGSHTGEYHGNFVPQIPRQIIQRYTKKGDVVVDGFLGSGTTLIESQRLGRHGIGIELLPGVAERAKQLIYGECNEHNVYNEIIVANSADVGAKGKIHNALKKAGKENSNLVILHPPYHDIIRFSDNPNDLSNTCSVEDFCNSFGTVIDNTTFHLQKDKYLVIVIGDKYSNSEWIPLGFYVMQEALKRDFKLKSIVVKDMQGNRAKQNQQQLWRYRALNGGFYIFKHEYIFILKKQ